jgi:hypothetical protein
MKTRSHLSKRKRITVGSVVAAVIFLLGQTHNVSAQWTGSPNIYYNGGNVGIGTTAPAYKFQVAGNSAVGVQSTADGIGMFFNAANSSYTQLQQTSTDFRIVQGYSETGGYLPVTVYTGGSERMRIDSAGKVGIGRPDPEYKLDVYGDTRVTGNITLTGTISGRRRR